MATCVRRSCTESGKYIADRRAGTNCVPCEAGKYNADRAATSCRSCPEGKAPVAGASACADSENLSRLKLLSVSPAACDADTCANQCMEELDLEIVDNKLTISPSVSSFGSCNCPLSTGTIDGGQATGTIVSVKFVTFGRTFRARRSTN